MPRVAGSYASSSGLPVPTARQTPKLYVLDSGPAAWLIGIESATQLATHPLRGALFETWVVAEFLKRRFHDGKPSNLSCWRDRSGHEIDLLAETADGIQPIEIEATATPAFDAFAGARLWPSIAKAAAIRPWLIYGGEQTEHRSDVDVVSWLDV